MKKLWLHAGTHKTGSTTIQNFLSDNNSELLNQGFLYPRGGSYANKSGMYNHNCLAHGLKGSWPSFIQPEWRVPKENSITAIRKHIRESEADNVIVSSEHLSRYKTLDMIERLWKCLDDLVSEVKIVLYLRRQDHLIESFYNQRVKLAMIRESFDDYLTRQLVDNNKFDYLKNIKLYSSVFGKENIVIRVFEEEQLHPKGLVFDFMETLGITDSSFIKHVPQRNVSLSHELIDMFRVLTAPYENYDHRIKLIKSIRNFPFKGVDKKKYTRFTADSRAHVLEFFKTSNQDIARMFLKRSNGILFCENEQVDLPIYPGISSDRLGELISQVLINKT